MNVLDEGVEFALGAALFLIALAGDSDSDSVGEVSDSLAPDELVEFGVDADVGGAHKFGDPLLDLSDGAGSLVLELLAMGQLMDVDGGVDGGFGEASPLLFLYHSTK